MNKYCEQCSMTFNSQQNFDIHQAFVHDIVPEFPCKTCGKIFMKEYTRKRHEPKCDQFKCRKCDSEFQNHHHVTRHEKECNNIPYEEVKRSKKEPSTNKLLSLIHNNDGSTEYETAFFKFKTFLKN